ncbi:MAG: Chitin synthase, class 1 [Thelocarpon impressellum]|nr:MAG: Chitin synthase, class 1 [Thelocarpon impressellum]
MSYNRLDFAGQDPDDDYRQNPAMDPRRPGRTPSPGHPLRAYTLEDTPYRPGPTPTQPPPGALEIPMGPGGPLPAADRLQAQPTYSVENINNSYGHNEDYEAHHPVSQRDYNYSAAQDYAISPEAHQDAYYSQTYTPSAPQDDVSLSQYPSHDDSQYFDHDDGRPILQADSSYGPNPLARPPTGYTDYQDEAAPKATPSPAPLRRWKTVKEVQLFNGNLVLDCPIPPRLLNMVPHAQPPERDEFTHMRYSAATCDPADFFEERFTLRQRLFAKPRHTELFIVVTMYNEDDVLFARTMSGVFKNVEFMCARKDSKTWGKEAWKKIVVCIVSDGRAKINPRTRAVLAGLGVYQDGIAKQQVNGKDVTAHVYEYTTQVGIEVKKDVVNLRPSGGCPVQLLFCLKEKNQKKINSHRWFFQAFGRVLDPNICVLIDAGTKPGRDSIYQLWKAFDLEPMCGGACGEIKAMLGTGGKNLLNPLVATQNFEYKMSNILDKPLESAFGFISVLPGAFSAYRFVALQNDKTGNGPLDKYFAGEKMHGANAGIFTANMYLAEDRILCFELVAKRQCHWILQYVKSSTGETDVPDTMAELILQRRRWLNGSFFAAVYALTHFYQIFRSSHSFARKMMFLLEFAYQSINMLFAWFAIGNFFLVFRILTTSLGGKDLLGQPGDILGVVFGWLYMATLMTCFVLALGNRPQGSNKFYMTMVYFWCGIMLYLIFASVFITVKSIESQVKEKKFSVSELFKNQLFFTLIVSLLSTYVLWFAVSFLFFDPWHMFTSFIQYLLLTPTYINILNVYAFCNTHDITWGTKGDDKAEALPTATLKPGGKVDVNIPTDDGDLNAQYEAEMKKIAVKAEVEKKVPSPSEKQEDYYKGFRSAVVLIWIFCNFTLGAVVLSTAGLDKVSVKPTDTAQRSTIYMAVVLWSVAGLSLFRFIGAMWFLVVRMPGPPSRRFLPRPPPTPAPAPAMRPGTSTPSTHQHPVRIPPSTPTQRFGTATPASSQFQRTPRFTLRHGSAAGTSSSPAPGTSSTPRLYAPRRVAIGDMDPGEHISEGEGESTSASEAGSLPEPERSTTDGERDDEEGVRPSIESADEGPCPPQRASKRRRLSPAPDASATPVPLHPPARFLLRPAAPAVPAPTPAPFTPFPTPATVPASPTPASLATLFSPHRKGARFQPAGLADVVRAWVVATGYLPGTTTSTADGPGGGRLEVREAKTGGDGLIVIRGRRSTGDAPEGRGEDEVKMLLLGAGAGARGRGRDEEAQVRAGREVSVSAPVWDVTLGFGDGDGRDEETWKVGVGWRLVG